MNDTPRSSHMSPEHIRIAELAKEDKERKFSSIAHLMTVGSAARGIQEPAKRCQRVDRVTYAEYAARVGANLQELHDRLNLKQGKYRAQPCAAILRPPQDEHTPRPKAPAGGNL